MFILNSSELTCLSDGVGVGLANIFESYSYLDSAIWSSMARILDRVNIHSVGWPRVEGNRRREMGGLGKVCYKQPTPGGALPLFVSFLLILIVFPHSAAALLAQQHPDWLTPGHLLNSRASNDTSALLDVIEVTAPVLSPANGCKQTLMVHTFAYSYGTPFVGDYTPPGCDFNRVTINFTVTSAGRQFDRLALMFFNNTEVFRTSTAEPTTGGIIWTYVKDMSNFLTLFQTPQKIIFDLGNLVDDTYTASWNTTLTATFFTAEDDTFIPADIIAPVSNHQSANNLSSGFTVPEQNATNSLVLPRNAKKAVFSIAACGQAAEEFWWSNVLSSDTTAFGNETTLYGYSPFRELQLYIDGTLAGVAWPFPVIFTGGVVPGFWRPVVGIDAFDLKEDEIDISAFLPLLSDGGAHTFEIRVAGINDDGDGNGQLSGIGSSWIVTGKVFLWLDSSNSTTTGTVLIQDAPKPSIELSSKRQTLPNGTVDSLKYSVIVARSFSVSSTIETSSGSQTVTWQQNLTYSNDGEFTNGGNAQTNEQHTSGVSASSDQYSRTFKYPLWVYSSYTTLAGGNYTIDGQMRREKNVQQIGSLAFPSEIQVFDFSRTPGHSASQFSGELVLNAQNGTASYLSVPAQKKSYGSGTTEQTYSLSAVGGSVTTYQSPSLTATTEGGTELYERHVLASNNSILFDKETFGGESYENQHAPQRNGAQTFANLGIKAMLGRGPF